MRSDKACALTYNHVMSPTIALIQGGYNAEKEISYQTAKAIKKAFEKLKYNYVELEADEHLPSNLKKHSIDMTFLAVHGRLLEDGSLQGLLEYLQIPYTGSGVLASHICMDKVFFKKILKIHNILTPNFIAIDKNSFIKDSESFFPKNWKLPFVVKPSRGGSSVGTFIIRSKKEFVSLVSKSLEVDSQVLIEEYIEGFDFTLPFFNNEFLPFIEIHPKDGFYDYKNKYTDGKADYLILKEGSEISGKHSNSVLDQCKKDFKTLINHLEIRQYARADFMITCDRKKAYFIEINTLPGFTESSLIVKSGSAKGLSVTDMVRELVQSCVVS